MQGALLALASVLLMVGMASPAHAVLTMDVLIKTSFTPVAMPGATPGATSSNKPGAADKLPENSEVSYKVRLDQHIAAQGNKTLRIYDFAKRRRYEIDTAANTVADHSLYDVVGFRTIELANRQRLREALNAAKIEANPFQSDTQLEHLLSVRATPNGGKTLVDNATTTDHVFNSEQGAVLARWSQAGTPVPAADAERFVKLVRYLSGGHPAILDKLAAAKKVPARLTFTYLDTGVQRTQEITVTNVKKVAHEALNLPGNPRQIGRDTKDPVDALLDQADDAIGPAKIATIQAALRADQEQLLAKGSNLEVLLSLIEWSLVSGQPIEPISPERRAQINADPAVQKFLKANSARSREELPTAIDTLVALRSEAPSKAYLLKVMEANHRLKLGKPQEARALFADALRQNIMLTGVYKDLGDSALMMFNTPQAWRAWDLGRRIAPGFSNFKAVNDFEANLARQQPAYF